MEIGFTGEGFPIPVVRECIWNALMFLLVLPTFDDTGSLGSPTHQVV